MIRTLLTAALLCGAAPALAQDEPPAGPPAEPLPEEPGATAPATGQGLDLTAEINLLSDYRFRGVSRSDEDPTVQASLGLVHDNGLYGGLRVTAIQGGDDFRARNPAFAGLGDAQIDLYAGMGGRLGDGFEYDAGVQYYLFVDGPGPTDYIEPYASLSYLIGPVYATAGAKYAPAQDALGGEDMLYLFGQVDVSIPFRPWSFSARLGRQDWRFGDYWTWSLGVEHQLQVEGLPDAALGLSYVDTSLGAAPGADAGLVASLRLSF